MAAQLARIADTAMACAVRATPHSLGGECFRAFINLPATFALHRALGFQLEGYQRSNRCLYVTWHTHVLADVCKKSSTVGVVGNVSQFSYCSDSSQWGFVN